MADQEWELQYLLNELRYGSIGPKQVNAGSSMLADLWHVSLAERDDDEGVWHLTDKGTALLALLEVEHCKRRIEAAGCDWEQRNDGMSVRPSTTWSLHWPRPNYTAAWDNAAEYAEAHAQGGGTDGAQG